MRVVLDVIGEAGVVLLGESLLGGRSGTAQRGGRNLGGVAHKDDRVGRGVVRVCGALLVEFNQLVDRCVSKRGGTDRCTARYDKNSRRSHDEPPIVL